MSEREKADHQNPIVIRFKICKNVMQYVVKRMNNIPY